MIDKGNFRFYSNTLSLLDEIFLKNFHPYLRYKNKLLNNFYSRDPLINVSSRKVHVSNAIINTSSIEIILHSPFSLLISNPKNVARSEFISDTKFQRVRNIHRNIRRVYCREIQWNTGEICETQRNFDGGERRAA